jgi:serine/threonine protein kinase
MHSLDSSDTGVTTTAVPPTHSTRRYSAPEVFDHMPRNRLTDIFSLGCVFADIVARLYGYKPDMLKTFRRTHGTKIDSYAENPDAVAMVFEQLTLDDQNLTAVDSPVHKHPWLASFVRHVLLEPDRLKRPTAAQILARFRDVEGIRLMPDGPSYIGPCCVETARAQVEHIRRSNWASVYRMYCRRSSLIDVFRTNSRHTLMPIFLNTDGSMLAHGDGGAPNYSTSAFVHDQDNKSKLAATINVIGTRHPTSWSSKSHVAKELGFAELANSVYISCSDNISSVFVDMRLYPWDAPAYVGTVRVVLLTLQMERRPLFGMPFAMVVFESQDKTQDKKVEIARRLKRRRALRRTPPRILPDPYSSGLVVQHPSNRFAISES